MAHLTFGAVTHRGTVRSVNQDSILAAPPVFVVADGIGGSEGGEIASNMVVEQFTLLAERQRIRPDDVRDVLDEAHGHVRALHNGLPYGAGTTACGAVALDIDGAPHWFVFNIGDSRIYRSEGDPVELVQLSVDHSHVQELMDAGAISADEAAAHPERNVVTRAVGSEDAFEPDFWLLPMVAGERLLICSDGLLADVSYATVEEQVLGGAAPQTVVERLLELSLAAGARDNVSIIVVDVAADQ